MKKLFLGTNLKMYKTAQQTEDYLKSLINISKDSDDAVLFVIPSYTALERASEAAAGSNIHIGAQNMHPEEQGQFTGEISPLMLKEFNVGIIEIGHSERRSIFKETDKEENAKVLSALAHGFTPLLCIGESAEDKEYEISDEILAIQLKRCLSGVPEDKAEQLMIAYEPVWAIGVNGVPAQPDYVAERHRTIKRVLDDLFCGKDIPVLYGGSVNMENAASLIKLDGVDGLFIGRSAWDIQSFEKIIKETTEVWQNKKW